MMTPPPLLRAFIVLLTASLKADRITSHAHVLRIFHHTARRRARIYPIARANLQDVNLQVEANRRQGAC